MISSILQTQRNENLKRGYLIRDHSITVCLLSLAPDGLAIASFEDPAPVCVERHVQCVRGSRIPGSPNSHYQSMGLQTPLSPSHRVVLVKVGDATNLSANDAWQVKTCSITNAK
jgi:hypothetical protein